MGLSMFSVITIRFRTRQFPKSHRKLFTKAVSSRPPTPASVDAALSTCAMMGSHQELIRSDPLLQSSQST
jgi:hypothetical protein